MSALSIGGHGIWPPCSLSSTGQRVRAGALVLAEVPDVQHKDDPDGESKKVKKRRNIIARGCLFPHVPHQIVNGPSMNVQFRPLERKDIATLWSIDRSESITGMYRVDNHTLVLERAAIDIEGWPPEDIERDTSLLLDCLDHAGFLVGAFAHETLVGACVLDSRFIGSSQDQLQLKFLHVSQACRGLQLGRRLFDQAVEKARALGARKLYISATPSAHTVNFYQSLGCILAVELDAGLFALEPQDIHMELVLRDYLTE
jgi:GNAT superfamily N-acetyltransferase